MGSDLAALAKRLPPDDEIAAVPLGLITAETGRVGVSDIQAVIVGSAAVEQGLRIAIGKHLSTTLTPTELDRLFVGDNRQSGRSHALRARHDLRGPFAPRARSLAFALAARCAGGNSKVV